MKDKRIKIIIGHYGSGKTEFSVNLAMKLAEENKKVAIADLDIVNPYFRSRERADIMESKGIEVISSTLGHNLSLDLPAVSSRIVGPIQDESFDVILDVGGNSVGAKVLARFKIDIEKRDYDMFFVVNTNRPETLEAEGIMRHIKEIEYETGLKVTGLIVNTHLLRETTVEDVMGGVDITKGVSETLDIPIRYVCAIEKIIPEFDESLQNILFPIKMYMRDSWM